MKKNDVFRVKISDMSDEGAGIGKTDDGFIWFIKNTVIGDEAEALVMKMKKNYGFARLVGIIKPSPDRTEPPCPIAGKCGGCQLQAMNYGAQLKFKERKVLNNLRRIGGFDIPEASGSSTAAEEYERGDMTDSPMVEDISGAEPEMIIRYRNKAQYPIGRDREGKLTAGFYAGRTHSIIPCSDCLLGPVENRLILEFLLSWMKKYGIESYDENSGRGVVRHLLIRKGFRTGEIMVCPVINARKFPRERELVEGLLELELPEGSKIRSISYSSNVENTNVIMGKEAVTIYGKPYIEDVIRRYAGPDVQGYDEVRFRISPLSFYQVNPFQMEKLYATALEYAGLTGNEVVWDLYCGTGTISLFLAKSAKKVYGVEIIPQAIENARENACINGIENVEFFVGKAEEVLPEWYEKNRDEAGAHPDVIVVDPPRKGCDERCLETILKMAPRRVVYVSCDSATLARDLKYLCGRGYELKRVRACDMFPMTVHVETIVLLQKLNS